MAVPSVFISSVVRGFEAVREVAARAVESVGMHPVLAERLAADPGAPRRALLDQVADSEVYLLLLGARYGDLGESGRSPTEEEYEEAVRQKKPILVLVQQVDMEPEQRAFLERVRGSWGEGVFHGSFTGPEDVGMAVAGALAKLQSRGAAEDAPAAQARAVELARGEERRGTSTGGVPARVAYVPLRTTTLLDPVALEAPGLEDDLAAALREAGVVSQRIGIEARTTGAGIDLQGTDADEWTHPEAVVAADGSVLVVGSVAAESNLGLSAVDPAKLEGFLGAAGSFARCVWERIDPHQEVGRVAIAAAIPEAEYKGFGAPSGGSMTIGHALPAVVVAPDPAEVVPRGQVSDDSVIRRITAAVRRVFADAGAVNE